jgi:hypothetical protein
MHFVAPDGRDNQRPSKDEEHVGDAPIEFIGFAMKMEN